MDKQNIPARFGDGLAGGKGKRQQPATAGARQAPSGIRDFAGRTPLMAAAESYIGGNSALVAELARRGDPAATNPRRKGWTALHYAAHSGNSSAAEVLAGLGAPHVADSDGNTPLHLAALSGELTLPAILPHADALARNNQGDTALHIAARSKFTHCVGLLIAVSDPHARNAKGWTPLMEASFSGSPRATSLLLSVSDAGARAPGGESAFDLANDRKHFHVSAGIQRHLAKKELAKAQEASSLASAPMPPST